MNRSSFYALLIGLLLLPGAARSDYFPDPGLPDGQEHSYRVKYVGGQEERPEEVPYARKALEHLALVEYALRVEHVEFQGKKAYKISRIEKIKNGDTAVETIILLREPKGLSATEIKREHKDAKGRLCKSIFVDLKAPSIKYPPDIVYYITLLAAGGAVAAKPKGTVVKFPLYVGDLNLVMGHATAVGPHTVKIGSKEIKTIKMEMTAELTSYLGEKFWVKPLQKFIPKIHYWFSEEPPHYLVRFEGGLGGPGAPVEVNELIK